MTVTRRLVVLAVAVALVVLPARASAQVLRGQVLAAEDNSVIRGAFIILVDTAGHERAASLSDADGFFRIQAPEPGVYRLRWEVVGRPIDQSQRFLLKAGSEATIRILSTRPRLLNTVTVSAASSCPANADAERISTLWVEVTKALRVSQWSVNDDRLLFDVETVRRTWDEKHEKILGETRKVYEGMIGRPFATMPPDFLAEYGYVVASSPGQHHYFAPDEKSLLHDTFIGQHCLSLVPPPPGLDALIGIAFTPAPDRYRPDISGTFWLHRDSLLLRAIDYRYSGLEQFTMHESLGGRMEFDRVPTGEWYIARWRITMPVMVMCRGGGLLAFLRSPRPCLDSIVEVAGEVLDVRHGASSGFW